MRTLFKQAAGFSLVEIILVIVILAIAVPPIIHLFTYNLANSVNSEMYTKGVYFAEERMEEILADKKATAAGRGFNYILVSGRYPDDSPETGFTRHVTIDTTGKVYSAIHYAEINVTVSQPNINDVVLTTWVTNYE